MEALVISLKDFSQLQFCNSELPFDQAHYLQILWSLCGKFYEGVVAGKYGENLAGLLILKEMGIENGKEVAKRIRATVLEHMASVNFLDCLALSSSFAGSMLELLKQLATLKEQTFVDPHIVATIVEMGFPQHAVRQAILKVAAPDVEVITEWILNHPEVLETVPEEEASSIDISTVYQVLINVLPAVPDMHERFADMLLRLCGRPNGPTVDVALMLLSLVGKLAYDLLEVPVLMEGTQMKSSLNPVQIEPKFEQLTSALRVLSTLTLKCNEVY